jgi:hypothetical protein
MSSPVSKLFSGIEALHGDRPWGHLLDAGTGVKSLQWIQSLDTSAWTAVTASKAMRQSILNEVAPEPRSEDRLVVGNWTDPNLLSGEQFDTVLVDYLVGAIEGFSPYWQDRIFPRLLPHARGRVYVVGLEPYVGFGAETGPAGSWSRLGVCAMRSCC